MGGVDIVVDTAARTHEPQRSSKGGGRAGFPQPGTPQAWKLCQVPDKAHTTVQCSTRLRVLGRQMIREVFRCGRYKACQKCGAYLHTGVNRVRVSVSVMG